MGTRSHVSSLCSLLQPLPPCSSVWEGGRERERGNTKDVKGGKKRGVEVVSREGDAWKLNWERMRLIIEKKLR